MRGYFSSLGLLQELFVLNQSDVYLKLIAL